MILPAFSTNDNQNITVGCYFIDTQNDIEMLQVIQMKHIKFINCVLHALYLKL